MLIKLVRWWLVIVGLLTTSGVLAQPIPELSGGRLLRDGQRSVEGIQATYRRVSDWLDAVRQGIGSVTEICLHQKLSRIEECMSTSQMHLSILWTGVTINDIGLQNHELAHIADCRTRTAALEGEALACFSDGRPGSRVVSFCSEVLTAWPTGAEVFASPIRWECSDEPTDAPRSPSPPEVFVTEPERANRNDGCRSWVRAPEREASRASGVARFRLPSTGGTRRRVEVLIDGVPYGSGPVEPLLRWDEGESEEEISVSVGGLPRGVHEVSSRWIDERGQVCSLGAQVEGQAEVRGRLVGAVVAAGAYRERPLMRAASDAVEFRNMLVRSASPLFGSESVRLRDVRVALNTADVSREIASSSAEANPEDLFVFFLVGHATTAVCSGSLEYIFVPPEGESVPDASLCTDSRVLRASDLVASLRAVRARRKLIVLDTCHSGVFARGANASAIQYPPESAAGSEEAGVYLLAAARGTANAQGFEVDAMTHGVLVTALREGLFRARTCVAGSGCEIRVRRWLDVAAEQAGEIAAGYGLVQNPQIASQGDDFVIGR